jgi:hypothetical protein
MQRIRAVRQWIDAIGMYDPALLPELKQDA